MKVQVIVHVLDDRDVVQHTTRSVFDVEEIQPGRKLNAALEASSRAFKQTMEAITEKEQVPHG